MNNDMNQYNNVNNTDNTDNNVSDMNNNLNNYENNGNFENHVNGGRVKKSKGNPLIVLLILIILVLVGYIVYDKAILNSKVDNNTQSENKNSNTSNNDNSNNKVETKKELDSVTKKELLSLIGLTENGLNRMEKSRVIEDGLDSSSEWVDSTSAKNSVFWVFTNFENGTYTSNDLSEIAKKLLITKSVLSEGKLVEVSAGEDENHPCYAGAGFCYGVSDELYKNIATRYGFNKNPLSLFSGKYDNKYYLIEFSPSVLNPYKIVDKLAFETESDKVKVIYDVKLTPYSMSYEGNKETNQTITFIFDQNKNLESFKVVNK